MTTGMEPTVPARVLLADDSALLRKSVRTMLTREGLDVIDETADGLEAVELAASHRPDVAILDLFMPGLNGLNAAREIHRVSPLTCCILLTSSEERYHVDAAMEAGIKGYVAKSDAADHLMTAITEVTHDRVFLSPHASGLF